MDTISSPGYPTVPTLQNQVRAAAVVTQDGQRSVLTPASYQVDPRGPQQQTHMMPAVRPAGYLIPVVPSYTRPPTAQPRPEMRNGPFPQGPQGSVPRPKAESYFSLLKSVTTPFSNGMSLSSLGRPWQTEQVLVTAAPPPSDMVSVHLWPPHQQAHPPPPGGLIRDGQVKPAHTYHPQTTHMNQLSDYSGLNKPTNFSRGILGERSKKELKTISDNFAGRSGKLSDTLNNRRKVKNRQRNKKSAKSDSALPLRLFTSTSSSESTAGVRTGGGPMTLGVSSVYDDQDDSSSGDDPFLDEGCEQFDEDLEPLDLSVRPPSHRVNLERVNSLKTQPPKRNLESVIASISNKRRDKNNNPCLEGKKKKKTTDSKLISKVGSKSGGNITKPNLLTGEQKAPLPIKKRQPVATVTKSQSGRHKVDTKRGDPNSLKNIRICEKCKCNFTCTMFAVCPLCAAPTIIESPSKVSNSNLQCLTSLPSQLSLHQDSKRIIVKANLELLQGTVLGPVAGKALNPGETSCVLNPRHLWVTAMGYSGPTGLLSTKDEAHSNWMRYVRLGHGKYNTAMVVCDGKVLFVTTQILQAGDEMLVKPENPLTAHLNVDNSLGCKVCGSTYASPLFLATHNALYHYPVIIKTVKPNATNLSRSKDEAPDEGKLPTPQAKASLEHIPCKPGISDRSPSPPPAQWKCSVCKIFFVSKADQEAHVHTTHPKPQAKKKQPLSPDGPRFPCAQCHAHFRSAWGLRQHSKVHSGDLCPSEARLFTCPHCQKAFWRKQSYRRHVLAHEASSEYQTSRTCVNCGRRFYSSSNLKVHMLTHSGIKPFICKVGDCATGFTTKQSLQFHYIKRHDLNFDSMPPIERCVPFTFEQYCGSRSDQGVKDEALEEGSGSGAADDLVSLTGTRADDGYRSCPEARSMGPEKNQLGFYDVQGEGQTADDLGVKQGCVAVGQNSLSDGETRFNGEGEAAGLDACGQGVVKPSGQQAHLDSVQTPAGSRMLDDICATKRCLWRD